MEEKVLSAKQAADYIGVSYQQLSRKRHDESHQLSKLKSSPVGGLYKYKISSLNAYLDSLEGTGSKRKYTKTQ